MNHGGTPNKSAEQAEAWVKKKIYATTNAHICLNEVCIKLKK